MRATQIALDEHLPKARVPRHEFELHAGGWPETVQAIEDRTMPSRKAMSWVLMPVNVCVLWS